MKGGWVYIVSNYQRTVFYIGVTSDIVVRIDEHKNGKYENSFSKRYRTYYLVYYSFYPTIDLAIAREKQLKRYKRDRKISLIVGMNPDKKDLYTQEFIKENYQV